MLFPFSVILRRKNKHVLLLSVLILFAADFAFANSVQTISIGLIADKSSSLDKSPLVSLLEVELSQKEGIQLLERAEIDKILEEQRLSAAGLQDRNSIMKIGQLLRADAFIMLSLESQIQDANDLIRVRFAETAHGLRLMDYFEQSDSENPHESVENIVQELESVLKKISQPDEKLIPIGIVDIHRVELGEQYKMLERTLPTMLSVRLSLEPQIIILEREDLKALLDEKLMTQGDDTEFWNSAILIDGYLQPHNVQLEMKLELKQADGSEIMSCTVSVEPNEPTIAIDKAAIEIIQKLQDTPSLEKWNPELEAEQFFLQGKMLTAHSRYEEALPLYETAHALQPGNLFYTGAIFKCEWNYRNELRNWRIQHNPLDKVKYFDPIDSYYSDSDLVEIVSTFVRHLKKEFEEGNLSYEDIRKNWIHPYGPLDNEFKPYQYFSSSSSVSTEYVRQLNKENRKIWTETLIAAHQKDLLKKGYPQKKSSMRAFLAWISTDTPEEISVNIKKTYAEYILPMELGGIIQSDSERENVCKNLLIKICEVLSTTMDGTHLQNADSAKKLNTLLVQYLKELTEVDDTIVKIYGLYCLSQINFPNNDKDNYYFKALDIIKMKLTENSTNCPQYLKQMIIKLYQDPPEWISLNSFKKKEDRNFGKIIKYWEEIIGYFIDKNDINTLAELNPGWRPFHISYFNSYDFTTEDMESMYSFFGKISQVLKKQSTINNKQITIAINNIKDFQLHIEEQFPEIKVTKKKVVPVQMLLSKNNWFKDGQVNENNFQIRIQNELLWVAFSSGGFTGHPDKNVNSLWPINIVLAGINLEKKELVAFWQAEVAFSNSSKLSSIALGDKANYLCLNGGGIVEFPGKNIEGKQFYINQFTEEQNQKFDVIKTIKYLNQENGLPSLSITSIAQSDSNELWLAYGEEDKESGLSLYNPETEQLDTILCSTLKGSPPFSDGLPYQISSLTFVNPDMLFFIASGIEKYGLWQMNINTYALKYLGPVGLFLGAPSGDTIEYIENKLLIKSYSYLIELDMDSKKMTGIYGDMQLLQKAFMDKNLTVPFFNNELSNTGFTNTLKFGPYYAMGNLDLSTGVIHNNKLWARLGKSQIIITEQGQRYENSQIINNNILDGEAVWKFVSTPYGLVAIGEGTVGLIEEPEK